MNVKELKDMLNDYDDDDFVIVSRDPEGNSYSPVSEWPGEGWWNEKESEYESKENLEANAEYHADDGYVTAEEWKEEILALPKCVVLFPTY